MKVDPKAVLAQATLVKAQPFKQLLAEARSELKKDVRPTVPPGLTLKATAAVAAKTAVAATSTTAQLTQKRVHADAEATRLDSVRAQHGHTAETLTHARANQSEAVIDRAAARILDFITRELEQDPPPKQRPLEVATAHHLPAPVSSKAPSANPEASAAQAVALIEKIEVFVKSQRPGLALTLTLNNSLGAHVEIERIGPKEIALKLVGHRGPPTAEAVSRMREELRARGLKVGALSVA
jgi:hypothetical protein